MIIKSINKFLKFGAANKIGLHSNVGLRYFAGKEKFEKFKLEDDPIKYFNDVFDQNKPKQKIHDQGIPMLKWILLNTITLKIK